MRSLQIIIFSFFVIFSVSLFAGDSNKQEATVSLGLVRTPALFYDGNEFQGILAAAFKCVFKEQKISVLELPSPTRVMNAVDAGHVDIGLLLEKNNNRDSKAQYIADFMSTEVFMVHRVKTAKNRQKVIAHRAGSKALEDIALPEGFKKIEVAKASQLFKMFELGRIDGFIELNGLISEEVLSSKDNIVTQIDIAHIGSYGNSKFLNSSLEQLSYLKEQFQNCQVHLPKVARATTHKEQIVTQLEH